MRQYYEQHVVGRKKVQPLTSHLLPSLSDQFSVGCGTSFVLAQNKSVKGSFRLAVQINVPATHPVSLIHKAANKFGCAYFPLVRHVATSKNREVDEKASSLGTKKHQEGRAGPKRMQLGMSSRRCSRITKALVHQTPFPRSLHAHTLTLTHPTTFTRRLENSC